MRLCVYTCITGGYDRLLPIPPDQNPQVDFVCFTDDPQLKFSCGNWQIRPIPSELEYLPKVKQQRIVKICPHRYLPVYDVTFWIDGNTQILSDVWKFVNAHDLGKITFWTRKHPARNCIYEEAKAVLRMKKDVPSVVNAQIGEYRKLGFPAKFGLHETNIILRRNTPETARFCNMWAKEILDHSHRDQLSFDYCRWKLNQKVGLLKIGNLTKDPNFRWRKHG